MNRFLTAFLGLSSLTLSACSTVLYIADTGVGQWKLMNRARPVEEVLASPYTKEKTKSAIRTVIHVKEFAARELGLKATKNYTSYVKLEGEYVSWAVSEAHPLRLEEKKWHFPIVGDIPYLGFFQEKKAHDYAENLRSESPEPKPDIWVRGVPAFSSLGWFSDPLYSSMIEDSGTTDIANLVIHESLHATVWVGDNVDFNEKLANFVGLEGSLAYLRYKKVPAEQVQEALAQVSGEKIFASFMKSSISRYKETVEVLANTNPTLASEKKKIFYDTLLTSYETYFAEQSKTNKNIKFKKPRAKFKGWNNAALLAYANYYSDFSVFEAMLKACEGSLPRFVHWIVKEKENNDTNASGHFARAPEEYLSTLVASHANCAP